MPPSKWAVFCWPLELGGDPKLWDPNPPGGGFYFYFFHFLLLFDPLPLFPPLPSSSSSLPPPPSSPGGLSLYLGNPLKLVSSHRTKSEGKTEQHLHLLLLPCSPHRRESLSLTSGVVTALLACLSTPAPSPLLPTSPNSSAVPPLFCLNTEGGPEAWGWSM